MITAKEAKKNTSESEKAKELLKEKHFLEVLKRVENNIVTATKSGDFWVDLKTNFMYPFRDRVISELKYNGYEVELHPSTGILQEYLLISWK